MHALVLSVALFALPALASAQAMNLKDVPDDSRATITKELARKNKLEKQGGDANESTSGQANSDAKGGCNMDVGSQDQSSRGARRTLTVVTGPVVQICK